MKKIFSSNLLAGLLAIAFSSPLVAQQAEIQYFRSRNKNGINVFEPTKGGVQPEYKGVSLRIGGSFTQDYQNLNSSNEASYVATSAAFSNVIIKIRSAALDCGNKFMNKDMFKTLHGDEYPEIRI